jgi:hypothetical protein
MVQGILHDTLDCHGLDEGMFHPFRQGIQFIIQKRKQLPFDFFGVAAAAFDNITAAAHSDGGEQYMFKSEVFMAVFLHQLDRHADYSFQIFI